MKSSEYSAAPSAPAPRYLYIHTFGCQMNEYDSLRVQRLLGLQGYAPTTDIEAADVIFLNTCSVRDKAEQKVHSLIGRLRRLKARNPALKIIVSGCVAQQLGAQLLDRFDYVDLVLGTRAIPDVGELLDRVQESRERIAYLPEAESLLYDAFCEESPGVASEVTAPVTIMQGCNNFCAYCIVPYVRGRERSRPSADILREIERLAAGGAREILLLGQNVNSYGRGLSESTSFPDLLHRIQEQGLILRLRFTTSHPKDLTEPLMRCFADLPVLCKYLHLPVQAGADRVLRRMNRGYTASQYLEKIQRLRQLCPHIGLSSDVMVGFPGETEAEFQETLRLLEAIEYDNLFSFRYSDRPHAQSTAFEGKIDEATKSRRLAELQALQAEITLQKSRAEIGAVREILVEGPSKASQGQLTGRTHQNRIVNFTGPDRLIGTIVTVRILDAFSHSLKGELLRTP